MTQVDEFPPDTYLFDEPRVRFSLEPDDAPLWAPGVGVAQRPEGLVAVDTERRELFSMPAATAAGVTPDAARALLARLDGTRTVAALRQRGTLDTAFDALVSDCFGRALFAPTAVAALEREISASEITRFPGSPYEVVRSYWRNAGQVRRSLSPLLADLGAARFSDALKGLHSIALDGARGDSRYTPASKLARDQRNPGRFCEQAPALRRAGEEVLIESGLRIGVPPVGGRSYHELLYASLGDEAASGDRVHRDEQGLVWGRTVVARSPRESLTRPWYCPVRPLTSDHFSRLHGHLIGAAAATSRDSRCRLAALFHQRFVQLHPFACANQSLAMNLVNAVLGRYGEAIPHLILDQLALRLSPQAYALAFRRAVEAYVAPPGETSAGRAHRLISLRRRAFALADELGTGRLSPAGASRHPDAPLLLLS